MSLPKAVPAHRERVERSFVEVVIVHGMGRQKASETLLEWSEALLRRIDWIATGGASENAIESDADSARLAGSQDALAAAAAEDRAALADAIDEARDLYEAARPGETKLVPPPAPAAPAGPPPAPAPPAFDWPTQSDYLPQQQQEQQVAEPEDPSIAAVPQLPPAATQGGADDGDDFEPRPTAIQYGIVNLSEDGPDVVNATVGYRGDDGNLHAAAIRFTEARWSEAVPPMSRSQVFAWGITFVWRAIVPASFHFGRVVGNPARISGNPVRLVVNGIAFLLIEAVTYLVGALLTVFVVAAGPLLVFPFVKDLAQDAIDTLVDFVGDAAVWGVRPVRAAAMRTLVRETISNAGLNLDTITRLRGSKPRTSLVVVAHSQGAAITADTLFNTTNGEPQVLADTLVTVGAAVTLLGKSSWTLDRQSSQSAVAAAGGRTVNRIRAWGQSRGRTANTATRWLNFWGIWDPIAAGPISTGKRGRTIRWRKSYETRSWDPVDTVEVGPEEHPVHNTASPLTDHQSYPLNVVQVVDPVARLILNLVPAYEEQDIRDEAEIANENHVRAVKGVGLQRVLVIVIFALSFAVNFTFGARVDAAVDAEPASGWSQRLLEVIAFLFNGTVGEGIFGWLVGLTWLPHALVAVPLLIAALVFNGWLWRYYSRKNDWRPLTHGKRGPWVGGWIFRSLLLIVVVTMLIVLGLDHREASGWFFFGILLAVVVSVMSQIGAIPSVVTERPQKPDPEPSSSPQ